MKNKYVRQARLPRGAFSKSLEEVLSYYAVGAGKGKKYTMKTIVEIFEGKQVKLQMPESVFEVLTNAYEKAQRIESNTTYVYMCKYLPQELRSKIKVLAINHIEYADESFSKGADVVKRYSGHDIKV